jgi:hypothetical protein
MSNRFQIVLFALLLPWSVSDVSAQDDHDHANEQKANELHDDHDDTDVHEEHSDELIVE